MKDSYDELELAKRRVDAQIQTLCDEVERQYKRILTHIVETHESDRKNNLDRFLTRAALEYPADIFERLKGRIRSQFPMSNTEVPVLFSTHPFQGNLASTHFKECKVQFDDEADIIRRYARQLQPQRMDNGFKQVSKAWVDDYNQKVSCERKRRHAIEGDSLSKSTLIVDESLANASVVSPEDF
ncbi:hypothetical protein CI238_02857 [Colletotrichum incanum]|uniref:Uncharacterized protein n=1 Tax=Colletotrichum incanum TaxID=1573173 RepID=A0A167CGJ3_COLIC|nr:hypothetical protein CI238_02857 [Colletotrichum incanum]